MDNPSPIPTIPVNPDSSRETNGVHSTQPPKNTPKIKIIAIILGVLLLISFFIAGYIAFQNIQLKNTIRNLKAENKNPVDTPKTNSSYENSKAYFPSYSIDSGYLCRITSH